MICFATMYCSLDPDKTIETISLLRRRIEERFPCSKLGEVCQELLGLAGDARKRVAEISRPSYWLRCIAGLLLVTFAGLVYFSLNALHLQEKTFHVGEVIQMTEALINDLIFVSVACFFLFTVEKRLKRRRALAALHELRSLAHVIDLHQLTKDPSLSTDPVIVATPSSPVRDMTLFELYRYLDYCTEMLSLTGKIAAQYAQDFRDSTVVGAVNDLEGLTTALSQKIWQKIVLLEKVADGKSSFH